MMKVHSRHQWRRREFLLCLYCVVFLHYSVSVASAPASRKSVSMPADTNVKGEVGDTVYAQNNPHVSIAKRSTEPYQTTDEIFQEIREDSSIHPCEIDPSLCLRRVPSWDSPDYGISDMSDEEMLTNNRNMLPYKMNQFNEQLSQEDYSDIADLYKVSHRTVPTHDFSAQTPKILILALPNKQSEEASLEDDEQPIREEKKNIFTSRGWGAGGMPFSVLYLHQHHHLKPVRSPIVGAQQLVAPPQPLRGFPSQYQQVAVRNAISSALTAPNPRASTGGEGTPLPTRRQYSIIPQLYVSYGWGPHGK